MGQVDICPLGDVWKKWIVEKVLPQLSNEVIIIWLICFDLSQTTVHYISLVY